MRRMLQGAPAGGWRDGVAVLASMRFAIGILCVLALASAVGTVLPQNQPLSVPLGLYGPFWTGVFDAAGLFQIYSSPAYVALMVFLVLSTSLCLLRHTPRLWRDVRRWRGQMQTGALRALPHHADRPWPTGWPRDPAQAAPLLGERLADMGWRWRQQGDQEGGVWLSARRGRYGRLGYVAAHGAVVLIALGGLLDGDALLRARMAWLGVTPYTGRGLIADVPAAHRLDAHTPAFRASLFVPEGARTGLALIARPEGAVVQPLPFELELRRFHADFWPSGAPRRFASDVLIHTPDGRRQSATVAVNQPLQVGGAWGGITLYQSSFEDGGSRVSLMAWPLIPAALAQAGASGSALGLRLSGRVAGPALTLPGLAGPTGLRLELADYRPLTVAPPAGDGRSVWQRLTAPARDAAPAAPPLGPRLLYRWRDAAGQARDFDSAFQPVTVDGVPVLAFGARDPRDAPDAPLRVLRIPVDGDGVRGWLRVLQALGDPRERARAVARAVARAALAVPERERAVWRASADRALALFAGALAVPLTPALAADREAAGLGPDRPLGGDAALLAFLQTTPLGQRPALTAQLRQVLEPSLRALVDQVRQAAGQPPLADLPDAQARWRLLRASLSDQFFYPAPALIQPLAVQPVMASVFEVARAPGRWLVYPGALLLALGVAAMLAVRDRRLWLLLQPGRDGTGGDAPDTGRVLLAMTGSRTGPALEREWQTLHQALLAPNTDPAPGISTNF
ncbi:cytochrome c biogenesis protein ResB [Amphibiibacter pelophylacis]|uniref:Cytochrome c biogenesis protein ResB n=1 Tax=Amphibiibacter pelophylacis TaxID=1799477 RepID=A0ACC6NY23_9BURK